MYEHESNTRYWWWVQITWRGLTSVKETRPSGYKPHRDTSLNILLLYYTFFLTRISHMHVFGRCGPWVPEFQEPPWGLAARYWQGLSLNPDPSHSKVHLLSIVPSQPYSSFSRHSREEIMQMEVTEWKEKAQSKQYERLQNLTATEKVCRLRNAFSFLPFLILPYLW